MDVASAGPLRVRLFARYAELLDCDELDLDLPLPATVSDIVSHLKRLHPAAADIPDRPVVAVNMEHVADDHLVQPGDELALLPPVAGG